MSDAAVKKVPLRGVRGMIADKMLKSITQSAQLTHHAECDITLLLEEKKRLKEQGVKVSIEDMLIMTLVHTLTDHPDMNATLDEKEIHQWQDVNLSIAIALPGNLLAAPAIFKAQELSLQEINVARKDLNERAKSNKLKVTEMTGGTFTISNLGLSRVLNFTPILNTPQVGIIGIGSSVKRAVPAEDGSVMWRDIMSVSLTFDHRAVDGAPAAEFLGDFCQRVEKYGQ